MHNTHQFFKPIHRCITLLILSYSQIWSSSYESDPNKPDQHGRLAIHHAVYEKDLSTFKHLFKDEDCNLTGKDKNGETFLHLAVKEGRLDIIEHVIAEDDEFNLHPHNNQQQLPVFYTVTKPCEQSHKNHTEIFKQLVFHEDELLPWVCFDTLDKAQDRNVLSYAMENEHLNILSLIFKWITTNDDNIEEFAYFKKALEHKVYGVKSPVEYYEMSSCLKQAFPDLPTMSIDQLKEALEKLAESHHVPNHTDKKPNLPNSLFNSINQDAAEEEKEDLDEYLISSKEHYHRQAENPLPDSRNSSLPPLPSIKSNSASAGIGSGYESAISPRFDADQGLHCINSGRMDAPITISRPIHFYGMQPMRSDNSASSFETLSMVSPTGFSSLQSSINFPKDQTPQQQVSPLANPQDQQQAASSPTIVDDQKEKTLSQSLIMTATIMAKKK